MSSSAPPPSQIPASAVKDTNKCKDTQCQSRWVDPLCSNKRCRLHCVGTGDPCALRGHNLQALSARQQAKVQQQQHRIPEAPRALPLAAASALPDIDDSALDGLLALLNMPIAAINELGRLQNEEMHQRERELKLQRRENPDSDVEVLSDVEIVSSSAIRQKRRMSDEQGNNYSRASRPRLTIDTSGSSTSIPSTPSLTSSSTSSSSFASPMTPTSDEDGLIWPHGMYTIDMRDGFLVMDSNDLNHLSEEKRFGLVFKCVYKRTTYGDQRRRWRRATEAQRQRALGAGRTPEGLWSVFSREVPLKHY